MSQQKHTPGPWHIDFDDCEADIHSGFGMVAKTMGHGKEQDDEGRANARRIAACVNACEGVRTEHLENNLPIVELVGRHSEALREIEALKAERAGLVDDINALKDEIQSQRDKILGLASAQVETYFEVEGE